MANLVPLLLNNVYSTVQAGSSAIGSSSATGVNIAAGDGANFGTIGTSQYIPCVIVDTSTTPETIKEYVWVTARSTDALTVVRQAEESSRYTASTTTIAAGYSIAAVATRQGLYGVFPPNPTPLLHGLLGWTYDVIESAATGSQLGAGFVGLYGIYVPATITVTKILMYLTTAGGGLTAGQNFAGLYDSSGTRLGVTADQSSVWNAIGLASMSLTGSVTIVGPTFVYGAFVNNGTTVPNFVRWASHPLSGFGALVNVNESAATGYRAAFFTTGSQTSLPTSINVSTSVGTDTCVRWMGLA